MKASFSLSSHICFVDQVKNKFMQLSFFLFFIFLCIQDIIRPLENPIKKTGHIQILYGNVAPEGSVAKITGKEGLYFSGTAFFSTSALLFCFNLSMSCAGS